MFRISQYLRQIAEAERTGVYPSRPARAPDALAPGPVVIWNLIRRCNLTCRHCYALSADHDYAGELTTAEALAVLADLKAMRVPMAILSGGEPLMRPDLWTLVDEARRLRLPVALSTNGTLIDEATADRIAAAGFAYVGISLDGLAATHDRFRRLAGAFDRSLAALRRLHARGVRVGLRYTMTAMNAQDLPALLALMRAEGIDKFYFSHLNYAGRGNLHRAADAQFQATRQAMADLFERAWQAAVDGRDEEYVTGNNDADGPFLLQWAAARWPRWQAPLRAALEAWGGNASGVHVANIDNLGNVHPDTMWWHHTLGNVRERPLSAIWPDTRDALMAGLKQRPRPVGGRCAACAHLAICGGNTRVRAQQITGDPWAEDPGCYLDDEEIGVQGGAERVPLTPFSARRTVHEVMKSG